MVKSTHIFFWQGCCILLDVMGQENKESISLLNHYSGQIIDAALKVHTKLGPGLLESVYEACLVYELEHRGLDVRTQVGLPVKYESIEKEVGYRVDLIVQNAVIVELKAVENIRSVHKSQLLSYLKMSGLRIGLLLNFNTTSLRDGIHRIVDGL